MTRSLLNPDPQKATIEELANLVTLLSLKHMRVLPSFLLP